MATFVGYFVPFIAGVALDFLYVAWFAACARRQALLAGLYSSLIGGAGLVGVLGAIQGVGPGVAYVAGLGLGSVAGVAAQRLSGRGNSTGGT